MQRQKDSPSDSSHPNYSHTYKLSTQTPLEDDSKTASLGALTTWSSDNELRFSSSFLDFKDLAMFRGLNAQERAGSRRLLELLATKDLFSLAGTVTAKKSPVCTRAEAIESIVQNSHSAYELLNRRKVLRDIIAAYLKNEGIPLLSRYTKAEVIQKTLTYWNNLDSCKPITGAVIPSSITQRQEDSDPDSPNPFYFHTLKSSMKERSHEDDSKTSNFGAPTPWSFNNDLPFSSIFTTCKSSNKSDYPPYNFQNTEIVGLNEQEKAGGRKLLQLLDTADLFSLAGTVTMKKCTVCIRAEAIDTIVQNSLSAYELLNRRKVLRDVIAAYLKHEGINLPPKFTKAEVVLKTLTYWNNLDSCKPLAEISIPSSIMEQQKDSPSDSSHQNYSHTYKSSTHTSLEDDSKTASLGALTTWSSDNELQFSSSLTGFKDLAMFRGLNAQERSGSRRLLELLETEDLFSLAGTVTVKKSPVCTRAEAVDTIVQNSQSAYELLNRRKVLRDIISMYLNNEGIYLPPKFTKAEAIQKTLTYWNNLEMIPAVMLSRAKDPAASPSIMKQEKFSDVSVRLQHKVSSDVSSYTSFFDVSKNVRISHCIDLHLAGRFERRGYPTRVVETAYHHARAADRPSLLVPKKKVEDNKTIRFIGTFDDKWSQAMEVLKIHWEVLRLDPDLAEFVPERASITYRRGRNLKDQVVHSHLGKSAEGTTWLNKSPVVGTFRCGSCKACSYVNKSHSFHSEVTGVTYTNREFINCNTTGIVYLAKCTCPKMYVGKTIRQFKQRILEHIGNIRRKEDTPISKHMWEHHRGNCGEISFQGVEKVSESGRTEDMDYRVQRKETQWIYRLKSLSPNGLNKSISFIPFI
ncbi:uncharacterized protein ACNLHF_009542 isoform 2-T2 [Anomaloglossus baeobatrachus]|uniref:uncharacterized protein LOC142290965 isoform X2 n=1 Tax=Anomaloglossus baeobatrachus TaxID=238106 RepID=UPI003F4FC2C6